MRKILFAVIFALLPLTSFAKSVPNASTDTYASSVGRVLLVAAGVVGGALLVDMLIGSSMTVPVASMTHPDIIAARTAGAVFGEQVAAATAIRDAEAKVAMAYTLLIGSGAVLGGLIVKQFLVEDTEIAPAAK